MIEHDKRNLERYEVTELFKENNCKTIDDVIELITDDYENDSHYVLKHRWLEDVERTLINRLNMIWVIPLFMCLAPFRYLVFGRYTVNVDSKFGGLLRYFIGDLP